MTNQQVKADTAVTVIILNWNGLEMTKRCLKLLKKQSFKDFGVVLVDNGSADGSAEYFETHDEGVIFLPQGKNLGFAAGVNRGIEASKSEYVVLLNNDAEPEANWLKRLVDTADKSPDDVGAVTSKMLRKGSGLIDTTGDFITTRGIPHPRGRDEEDNGQYDDSIEVFSGGGGATLYKRAMLDEIGLFDESFFMYYEDVDLGFRAQLEGYRVILEPRAVVRHQVSASANKVPGLAYFHCLRNSWYLYIKNMPGALFWKQLPLFLAFHIKWAGGGIVRGQIGLVAKAYADIARALPSLLAKRRAIQKARRRSAAEIRKTFLKLSWRRQ